MGTLLALCAGVLETCAAVWLVLWLNKKKIAELKLNRKTGLMFLGVCAVSVVFSCSLVKEGAGGIEYLLQAVMYVLLLSAAAIDWEQKIVPNRLLVLGLFLRTGIFAVEAYFYREIAVRNLLGNLKSVAVVFVFLMMLVIISRHSFGLGDVKLLCVMVLYIGLVRAYNCFFAALLVSGVVSVYLLVVKRTGKKYRMAFVPYLYIGYVLTIVLLTGGLA